MVAYSFKKQFGGPILASTKAQTIRGERKRHARPGEEVQLYVGMRTKYCRLIGRATCLEVASCRIDIEYSAADVYTGDGTLSYRLYGEVTMDAFAIQDGFDCWDDMERFWRRQNPGVLVFEGVLIRWTDFAPASRTGGGDAQMDMFAEATAP